MRTRVLVTGANRGIGLEFVRQYAAQGAKVFAATRKVADPDLIEAKEKWPDIEIVPLDIMSESTYGQCFKTINARESGLDILINNAAVCYRKPSMEFTFEELVETFTVNVVGPVSLVKVFLPLLKAGKNPLVVNITSYFGSLTAQENSGVGDSPSDGPLGYCASKAALNMASLKLADQLAPLGIRVLTQAPGWVKTVMGTEAAPSEARDNVKAMIKDFPTVTAPRGGFREWDGSRVKW